MSVPATQFGEYLAEDESVLHGVPGTFIDGQSESEGTIGITDRRVVFLSERNRFVDVTHDAIYSITSRPRTSFTAGGLGYRLLLGAGALVAVLSVLAVASLGPVGPAFLLATLTIGSAVGAEYARRNDVEIDADLDLDLDVGLGRIGLASRFPAVVDTFGRFAAAARERDEGTVLVFGLAYVGLIGLVALVIVTGSLAVVPLVLLSLVGLALADGAHRRTRTLDRYGRGRRREWEVSIHLADGRHVRLRVDEAERLDRELSGVARQVERPSPDGELTRPAGSGG